MRVRHNLSWRGAWRWPLPRGHTTVVVVALVLALAGTTSVRGQAIREIGGVYPDAAQTAPGSSDIMFSQGAGLSTDLPGSTINGQSLHDLAVDLLGFINAGHGTPGSVQLADLRLSSAGGQEAIFQLSNAELTPSMSSIPVPPIGTIDFFFGSLQADVTLASVTPGWAGELAVFEQNGGRMLLLYNGADVVSAAGDGQAQVSPTANANVRLIALVPEPAGWILGLLALVALIGCLRRYSVRRLLMADASRQGDAKPAAVK